MILLKIFSVILVILGAVITYGANKIYDNFIKEKSEEKYKEVAMIKLIGFAICLVGAVILFVLF